MSPNFLSYNESSISFSRCGVSKEAGSLYIKILFFLFVVGKKISSCRKYLLDFVDHYNIAFLIFIIRHIFHTLYRNYKNVELHLGLKVIWLFRYHNTKCTSKKRKMCSYFNAIVHTSLHLTFSSGRTLHKQFVPL